MNVLVVVASRHGSTHEIAEALARELRALGNWLPDARKLVERNRARLATVPVWLFSSGPLGQDDPQPKGYPQHLDELMQETSARGHRTFVGKLDKSKLGLGERLIAGMVKAPEGDF
jgi:menaquinone-dependent protoporphyrinogen oxidase